MIRTCRFYEVVDGSVFMNVRAGDCFGWLSRSYADRIGRLARFLSAGKDVDPSLLDLSTIDRKIRSHRRRRGDKYPPALPSSLAPHTQVSDYHHLIDRICVPSFTPSLSSKVQDPLQLVLLSLKRNLLSSIIPSIEVRGPVILVP